MAAVLPVLCLWPREHLHTQPPKHRATPYVLSMSEGALRDPPPPRGTLVATARRFGTIIGHGCAGVTRTRRIRWRSVAPSRRVWRRPFPSRGLAVTADAPMTVDVKIGIL